MHFSYDHYDINPTLPLAQVPAQNNSCPCSALHLLDHSSLKYRQQTWNAWIWPLALASTQELAPSHRIYLYASKNHKCYFSFLRGMTQSASVLNSGAHSFRRLGVKNCLVFFNFPVSRARPEKIVWFLLAATSNHVQVRLDCRRGKKILCQQRREK